jgi:hypothetical protein
MVEGLTTVYEPLKDLPHWSLARHHQLFASNVFLDHRLEDLKRESEAHFDTIGPLVEWGTLVPQSALSAYFIVKGEKGSLKISFALSPEHAAQIQDFSMESMQKS